MKNLAFIFVTLLSLLLTAIGCEDVKTAAVGEDDEIIVFADSLTWQNLSTTLKGVFEDTVFTPQPETWFRIRRVPFSRYGDFEEQKNRLVVAPLDGKDAVAEFVSSSLNPSVRSLVDEGKEYVFTKYDSRARGQILMFLAGKDLPTLRSSIENGSADLIYFFKNMSLKRELAALADESKYAKKELEEHLSKTYGWTMTIQHDYFVAVDSASSRFFWIRRANPADMERWIFVHWIDSANPAMLTNEFVIHLRDSLTRRFLRTLENDAYVQIAPYNLQIQTMSFEGKFAYETRGNWRFSDKSGGGPFVNYMLYDEDTRRIYMLDGSIFAPRVEKKKLILQVDGILHTFQPSTKKPAGPQKNQIPSE